MISSVKLVAAGIAVSSGIAELVPRMVSDGLGAIALLAAATAGAAYLARAAHRAFRNGRALAVRVHRGVDVIETVPERLDKIEGRLEEGEKHFERIDKSLDAIADSERSRIHDAIARDQQRSAAGDRRT